MPSKRLFFALTVVAALLGVAMVSRSTASAASATREPPMQTEITSLCYHTDPSDYHCPNPDSTAGGSIRLPSADALGVESITITVTEKGGRSYTNKLPATTDAIFLSRKSLHTFLLLHYLATDDRKFSALSDYLAKAAAPRPSTKPPAKRP